MSHKHDFTKTMRNVSLNDTDHKPRRSREMTIMVDIDATDQQRLKAFMAQELNYYNTLVNALTPRCLTFPETILALHEDWITVFGQIAYEGRSIKNLEYAKPDAELTEGQEPYRKFLVGKDSQGNRFMTESMFSIMSAAAAPATLHPVVRRNMAVAIIKHLKEQASRVISRNQDGIGDAYKVAPEMLQTYEFAQKRHLQMPRSTLYSVKWNSEKECTEISHCYSSNPLVVPKVNLESDNNWNLLILHQQTGVNAVPATPWVVDIRTSLQPYLLKYVDLQNPRIGNSFYIAKRR